MVLVLTLHHKGVIPNNWNAINVQNKIQQTSCHVHCGMKYSKYRQNTIYNVICIALLYDARMLENADFINGKTNAIESSRCKNTVCNIGDSRHITTQARHRFQLVTGMWHTSGLPAINSFSSNIQSRFVNFDVSLLKNDIRWGRPMTAESSCISSGNGVSEGARLSCTAPLCTVRRSTMRRTNGRWPAVDGDTVKWAAAIWNGGDFLHRQKNSKNDYFHKMWSKEHSINMPSIQSLRKQKKTLRRSKSRVKCPTTDST